MLKTKFLDDIFDQERTYEMIDQGNGMVILKDCTNYTQEGTKINALLMQSILDEINQNTPIGVVYPYAGKTAPRGYLLCQGQEVSREVYADLFQVIGTSYGAGDGKTTFLLPDLRQRYPMGANTASELGVKSGAQSHTLTENEMPRHTHLQNAHTHTAAASSAGAHGHTASSGSAGAHTHSVSGTTTSAGQHRHNIDAGTNSGNLSGGYARLMGSWEGNYPKLLGTYDNGNHTHTTSGTAASAGAHTHSVSVTSSGSHSHTITNTSTTAVNQSTGGGAPFSIMNPHIQLNYIIKY